ncbi:MAG TPA: cytochrome P450 [Actinophytocola sp.]|uniref:cytochrome P450 n=1 Tax=Actinophytocola sp. TaxID=1872138 RepID=UPI002DBB2A24|nr:cytochrome P450 [Actinophytocola sp.]HEU5472489.1 cytochrome P450 [Actinophytocola sp.]
MDNWEISQLTATASSMRRQSMAETTDTAQVPVIDITDPTFDYTSREVVAAQARSWYAHTPIGLLVLRHAEANDLLRGRHLNGDGIEYLRKFDIVDGPIYDWFVPVISNRHGEEHRRLRGLVSKAFTPRMIDRLRPFIRSRAEDLTGRIAPNEPFEFAGDLANPLSLAVMGTLLGVPPEDHAIFGAWTADLALLFALGYGGDTRERVTAAITGLTGYVENLLNTKKPTEDSDLISALLAARQTGSRVSAEELVNLVVMLVFAAHDTTRHQLGNAMVTFTEYPEQWRLLGQHPELADRAVNEAMRWSPSVIMLNRIAAEDFEYHGLPINRGTVVAICAGIAQRDPRAFPSGDTFDITASRTAPLLQFGAGPHHCLGAALARTEIGEALPVLTRQLGPPTLAGPINWLPPLGVHGPATLPLRFGAAR